jgi:hypothetical protein
MARIHKRAVAGATETTQELKRNVTKSQTFASLYANDVQVQMSPWDMRLVFGEVVEQATRETLTIGVLQVGELRISPQLAKQLTAIMCEQLNIYEEQFGPIPVPRPASAKTPS